MSYSNVHRLTVFLCAVLAIVAVDPANAGMCKWVDENGSVHYAETCPEGINATDIEIQPPPPQEHVSEADRQSAKLKQLKIDRKSPTSRSGAQTHAGRSLPLEELGPLPENTTSTYLTTLGSDYTFDNKSLTGQFFLTLQARDSLPGGAWLEAHFPNPANAERKQIIGKELSREGGEVSMFSPKSSGFKCWNYEIEVLVYEDKTKEKLLDTHRQGLQSRVDLSLVRSSEELIKGMAGGGICPSAHQSDMENMSAEKLEALCERERQKYLEPERQRLIEQCIKRGDKQDEWCENYYQDWGDAQRVDISTLRRARYYDLPECVAAKEARDQSRR